jgi:hypothetical protein
MKWIPSYKEELFDSLIRENLINGLSTFTYLNEATTIPSDKTDPEYVKFMETVEKAEAEIKEYRFSGLKLPVTPEDWEETSTGIKISKDYLSKNDAKIKAMIEKAKQKMPNLYRIRPDLFELNYGVIRGIDFIYPSNLIPQEGISVSRTGAQRIHTNNTKDIIITQIKNDKFADLWDAYTTTPPVNIPVPKTRRVKIDTTIVDTENSAPSITTPVTPVPKVTPEPKKPITVVPKTAPVTPVTSTPVTPSAAEVAQANFLKVRGNYINLIKNELNPLLLEERGVIKISDVTNLKNLLTNAGTRRLYKNFDDTSEVYKIESGFYLGTEFTTLEDFSDFIELVNTDEGEYIELRDLFKAWFINWYLEDLKPKGVSGLSYYDKFSTAALEEGESKKVKAKETEKLKREQEIAKAKLEKEAEAIKKKQEAEAKRLKKEQDDLNTKLDKEKTDIKKKQEAEAKKLKKEQEDKKINTDTKRTGGTTKPSAKRAAKPVDTDDIEPEIEDTELDAL